jgi:hypothetical protein
MAKRCLNFVSVVKDINCVPSSAPVRLRPPSDIRSSHRLYLQALESERIHLCAFISRSKHARLTTRLTEDGRSKGIGCRITVIHRIAAYIQTMPNVLGLHASLVSTCIIFGISLTQLANGMPADIAQLFLSAVRPLDLGTVK